jgi:hypothetical protein
MDFFKKKIQFLDLNLTNQQKKINLLFAANFFSWLLAFSNLLVCEKREVMVRQSIFQSFLGARDKSKYTIANLKLVFTILPFKPSYEQNFKFTMFFSLLLMLMLVLHNCVVLQTIACATAAKFSYHRSKSGACG